MLFTEDSSLTKTFRFFFLLLISANSRWFRHFWYACDLRKFLLATRNCKNFGIILKLRQVSKNFKSSAALRCLKSTFSNFRNNLTIVFPYRLPITCNNDNLLENHRLTKKIKTNASVLKNIFLNQLIFDWCKTHFICNDFKLRNQTYYDFQTLNQSCVWQLTASIFKWLTALSWQFHKISKVASLYNQ